MNSQFNSRTADKFVVRLPDGLRAQVEQAADNSDTSMNTVFVQAVRQYLDNQDRQQLLLDALALAIKQAQAQPDLVTLEQRHRAEFEAGAVAERRVEVLEGLLRDVYCQNELCLADNQRILAALNPTTEGASHE